jgi:archaellum component FlaF (FlaF/FlaG flagellin family)
MRSLAVVSCVLAIPALAQTTTRVSVTSSGAQVVGHSEYPAVSHDGRYVAYLSKAPGLVPEDANNIQDIFRHDRYTGAVQRISVSTAGVASNGLSDLPSISGDGRFVAYQTFAGNFDAADLNGASYYDIYVRDTQLGTTELMSKSSAGVGSSFGHSAKAKISANGVYVVFESDSSTLVPSDNGAFTDIFVHNRVSGETFKMSTPIPDMLGTAHSYVSSISGDGSRVTFQSTGSNLVAGDTNSKSDIFLREWIGPTPSITIVSRSSAGVQGDDNSTDATISADGKFVVFSSRATNLVAGDTNGANDIFVRDLVAGTTERVSVSSSGVQGNSFSNYADISADGRYVVFHSSASNLVAGDTNSGGDLFRRDRLLGTTTMISVMSGGALAGAGSQDGAISGDGRFVAYFSGVTNLVPNDTNDRNDVFFTDPAGLGASVAIRTGAGNVPSSLTANGLPIVGNAGFGLVYDNPTSSCGVAPGSFVVTALDFNGAITLPLFNGCAGGSGTLLVNVLGPIPEFTVAGVWNGTPATAPMPIPADLGLCGLAAHGQSFFVVLPSLAIHPSDAVDIVVGQ